MATNRKKYIKAVWAVMIAVVIALSLSFLNLPTKTASADNYYSSSNDFSNWFVVFDPETPITFNSATGTEQTYNMQYTYYDIYIHQIVNATQIKIVITSNDTRNKYFSIWNPNYGDHALFSYYYMIGGTVYNTFSGVNIAYLITNYIPYSIDNLLTKIFTSFKTFYDLTDAGSISNFSDWWNSTPNDLKTILMDIGIPTWNEFDSESELGDPANNPPINFSDIQKGVDGLNMVISEQERVIYQQEQTIQEQQALLNRASPYIGLDMVETWFKSLGSLLSISIGPIPLYVFITIPIVLLIIYMIFKLIR